MLPGLLAYSRQKGKMHYTVSVEMADTPYFHVKLEASGFAGDSLLFKLPAWTPGYYQLMHYADQVRHFDAKDAHGNALQWKRKGDNGWMIYGGKKMPFVLEYDVRSTRPFVAANYADKERAYISPAGMFMYPDGHIRRPVSISVRPAEGWTVVESGMDRTKGVFRAPDFDILYDSPILMGKLEELPAFTVKGIWHRFVAYRAGDFDRAQFMADLQKIVQTASGIIGDIPYQHYTFLAIGPGGGGIEHLNSAAVAFSGDGLHTREGKIRIYNFLAHEYFHHYNVKRIRPVELGPFDYDHGSKTRLLWVSEGFTVYYEYLILKRAGLTTAEDVFKALKANILAYESKPGKLVQSAAAASYETWSDGPFGRSGEAGKQTISYYDKGPVLGALLDFRIRHETKNRYSLDDVMRTLYREYYQKAGRGFTEQEFRAVCEKTAGTSLAECFDYANTVRAIDYKKYFAYAGLDIDEQFNIRPVAQPNSLQAAILKDWLK